MRPGLIFHFWSPHRPSKVPNGRLEAGHHIRVVAEKGLERRRSSSESRGKTHLFSPSIPPALSDATAWILILHHPQLRQNRYFGRERLPEGSSLGSSIHRCHRAWMVTAGTIGLTEVRTIRIELLVVVD
ncbi:hypothetical protein WN944_001911 [Citrus x changshan-huyou]|uniref:Uncharacterized protein n=1 Tax=Citrus x changshan-huyou TaxID=2935761 RepID=A0AAP0QN29_9ROSI